MVDLAFWTDLAIWTLVVLPLVVFAWFLHDAAALLREIKEAHEKRVES